jgi:HEAT repeat protein
MIKSPPRSVCLWFFLVSCLAAQNRVTKLRGTVQDATTKKPVAGATVSASGDTAQKNEITDDKGFFRILIGGVAPGDLVRIRVEKPGYAVYDRQVVASEEIPLTILLHRPTSATPPPVQKTIEPAPPADPVAARYIQEMKDQNPMIRLNALKVLLDSAPRDRAAMSAVIAAALDVDYRVRLQAVYDIGMLRPTSKQAVTNLLIGLRDPEPLVQAASLAALGSFPADKDALAALFRLLGTPPSINKPAMYSLIRSGVEDSRLSQAIFYEVTLGNADAIAVMLKKAPLSQELISRLIVELGKSLDSPRNFHTQGIIQVLLRGGGEPGRQAMHQFLAAADPYHQSRLVLCWLEVDHRAKAEILQLVRLPDLTAELRKALTNTREESVFLPDGAFPLNVSAICSRGVMLRAAMGMLVLDLEPRKDAWDVLAFGLDRDRNKQWQCGTYSATVPGWLSPPRAKRVIPLLVADLKWINGGVVVDHGTVREIVDEEIIRDTLAKIGDEDTITLLQRSAAEVIGGNDPLGKKFADLIARIRSRMDK